MKMNKEEHRLVPPFDSRFLNTACRVQFNANVGVVNYLEPVHETDSVRLEVKDTCITTSTYRTTSKMNSGTITHLAQMGVDPVWESYIVARNEAQVAREKELHKTYSELGEQSLEEDIESTWWKRLLHGRFGISHVDYVEPKRVYNGLQKYSNKIFAKSLRGPANFAIVNRQQLVYLEENPAFVYAMDRVKNYISVEYVGHIGDMEIYVNNHGDWQDRLVIGKKTSRNDVGVYYCEYNHEFETMEEPHTGNTLSRYSERCTITPVGNKPHLAFYTINLRIGKRPLWRRILGI